MAPSSQELEPPGNPGRFTVVLRAERPGGFANARGSCRSPKHGIGETVVLRTKCSKSLTSSRVLLKKHTARGTYRRSAAGADAVANVSENRDQRAKGGGRHSHSRQIPCQLPPGGGAAFRAVTLADGSGRPFDEP